YHGLVTNDNITVTYGATTTIANGALKTVGVLSANTELLKVLPAEGDDIVSLTGDASLLATIVDGGIGNDSLNASAVTTGGGTLLGNSGEDTLTGGAGDDRLEGGDGRDVLRGGTGVNVLEGGADSDIITVSSTANTVDGGAGDEVLNLDAPGGAGTITISATDVFVNATGPGAAAFGASNVEQVNARPTGGGPIDYIVPDLSGTPVRLVGLGFSLNAFNSTTATGFAADTVTVDGTQGADAITVASVDILQFQGPTPTVLLPWGRVSKTFSGNTFAGLTVNGLGGDDTIRNDPNAGLGATPVTLNGGD